MLSVKVLVPFRHKVAVLYLKSMEGINVGGTSIIIVHVFTGQLYMVRNSLEEHT